jgi:hypothetical protein
MGSESDAEKATGEQRSPETVDRVMVGVCGAIWLVLLAVTVIATVALVQLGQGQDGDAQEQSSWLLYSVIAVSALVIAGAIPLLMRARRAALADPVVAAEEPVVQAPVRPVEAPTEKLRVFGTSVDPYASPADSATDQDPRVPTAVIDRLWLRGTTSLFSAIGVALIAVATGTYLLATGNDTASWVALGAAAVITVAMPAILVAFQRLLADAADIAAE